jgi:hypothetical protein
MVMRAGRSHHTRLRAAMLTVGMIAAVHLAFAPAAGAAPGPTVITPNADLVDGQVVTVTGTGYDPFQRLEIFQCVAGAVDEFDCDLRNAYESGADGAGVFTFAFKVDARIYVGDPRGPIADLDEVDCRAAPGACVIGIGYVLDADEAQTAPLFFDPDAPLSPPVAMTATPTEGLVDGQIVTVNGFNLTDREETFVYQCIAGAEPSGATCDFPIDDVRGVAAPDGTITLEWPAKAVLYPPFGGTIDCTTAPGACEVVLSWGFIGAPDRIARTPISFGGPTPPPPPPPAAPSPTTTTVQASPAAITPAFTG